MHCRVQWQRTPQTSEPTIEQLQTELRQRDAIIRNLVRRVEKLERQVGTGASLTASPGAGPTRSVARSQAGARPPAPALASLEPAKPAPTPAGQRHSRRRRPVRHSKRRTPTRRPLTHRRPGSSKSVRRLRNAPLSGHLSPPAICWCRRVLPKSSPCSATRAASFPPKSFLM